MGSVSNLIGIRGRSRGYAKPPPSLGVVTAVANSFPNILNNTGNHDLDVLANDIWPGHGAAGSDTPILTIVSFTGPSTPTVVGTGAAQKIRISSDTLTSPANTGGANLPAISGTPTVGNTLTVSNGTWSGNPAPTFTYQWLLNGANISGANANTRLLTNPDVGQISARVTATNSEGFSFATSAEVTVTSATPAASVASVDALAGGYGGLTSYSRSFTVPSGSNRKLIMCFAYDTGSQTISNVKFDSAVLTKIHSASTGTTNVEIWERNNPTVNTLNLTWDVTNTANMTMIAVNVQNASFAAIPTTAKTSDVGTGLSASSSLAHAPGALLLDIICGSTSTVALTEDGQGTQIANVIATGQSVGAMSALTTTTSSSSGLGWTWSSTAISQPFAQAMIMILPA